MEQVELFGKTEQLEQEAGMNTMITFGIGFAIGCLTGVLMVALCFAAREMEDE